MKCSVLVFLVFVLLCIMTSVWSQNELFSQPLWSYPNDNKFAGFSKDRLFVLNDGEIQVFNLANGSFLTTFEKEVDYFQVSSDALLVIHNLETERLITVYDASSLIVNWQKSYSITETGTNFILAEHVVVVTEKIKDSNILLNAYDTQTSESVWSSEKDFGFDNFSFGNVKGGILFGSGHRPMTTSSILVKLDLETGEILEACGGRICASHPIIHTYKEDGYNLSTNYGTNSLFGFSRFDFTTRERLHCAFGANGYIHENGEPYTDDDFKNKLRPFQVDARSSKVLSDGISLVLTINGKIYQYPMCDEAHQDNLLESGGSVLSSNDSKIEIIEFNGNRFLLLLTNANQFEVVELVFADGVKGEFIDYVYSLSSQYPFSVFPIVTLDRVVELYETRGKYLSILDEGVFEIFDLESGENVLRIPIEAQISRGFSLDDLVNYQILADYIIYQTPEESLVFNY